MAQDTNGKLPILDKETQLKLKKVANQLRASINNRLPLETKRPSPLLWLSEIQDQQDFQQILLEIVLGKSKTDNLFKPCQSKEDQKKAIAYLLDSEIGSREDWEANLERYRQYLDPADRLAETWMSQSDRIERARRECNDLKARFNNLKTKIINGIHLIQQLEDIRLPHEYITPLSTLINADLARYILLYHPQFPEYLEESVKKTEETQTLYNSDLIFLTQVAETENENIKDFEKEVKIHLLRQLCDLTIQSEGQINPHVFNFYHSENQFDIFASTIEEWPEYVQVKSQEDYMAQTLKGVLNKTIVPIIKGETKLQAVIRSCGSNLSHDKLILKVENSEVISADWETEGKKELELRKKAYASKLLDYAKEEGIDVTEFRNRVKEWERKEAAKQQGAMHVSATTFKIEASLTGNKQAFLEATDKPGDIQINKKTEATDGQSVAVNQTIINYNPENHSVSIAEEVVISSRAWRFYGIFEALKTGNKLHSKTLIEKIWNNRNRPNDEGKALQDAISEFRAKFDKVKPNLGHQLLPEALDSFYKFDLENIKIVEIDNQS